MSDLINKYNSKLKKGYKYKTVHIWLCWQSNDIFCYCCLTTFLKTVMTIQQNIIVWFLSR